MDYKHIPVMLEEVLANICLKKGDFVLDCTLGGAGYTSKFSELVGPKGRVVSLDLDDLAIKNAEKALKEKKIKNVTLINDSFHNIKKNLEELDLTGSFSAVVMDLGLSSAQLDDERRGFSFKHDSPLDMTFGGDGQDNKVTADIINWTKERDLEKIISQYGEEKFARRIAASIVKARRIKEITRSSQLLDAIKSSVPESYIKNSKIHFATRTFQAIRIASNNELKVLEEALPQALDALKSGGRLAVVSFHSLEDRIVKQFFKNETLDCICLPELPVCRCNHQARIKIITRKPIEATREEAKSNPRARSAKMRVGEKI